MDIFQVIGSALADELAKHACIQGPAGMSVRVDDWQGKNMRFEASTDAWADAKRDDAKTVGVQTMEQLRAKLDTVLTYVDYVAPADSDIHPTRWDNYSQVPGTGLVMKRIGKDFEPLRDARQELAKILPRPVKIILVYDVLYGYTRTRAFLLFACKQDF